MAFDLNSFFTSITQDGFTNPSKFDVTITTPNCFSSFANFSNVPQLLQFRAEHVVAPSVLLSSNETHPYGAGPLLKQPSTASMGDIHITFIADQKSIIYNYFYNWMNYIYNFSDLYTDNGISSFFDPKQNYSSANYLTGFEDNNVSPVISINYYNNIGQVYQKINAYRAKPLLLSSSHLDWNTTNQFFKIHVTLGYREWSLAIPNLAAQSSQNIQQRNPNP